MHLVSAINPTGWITIGIVLLLWTSFVEFHLWRGKLAPLKTAAFRRQIRVLSYVPPGLLTLLVALVSVPPVWHWYSSATLSSLFGLGIVTTGALTVWVGSLVAFTISQRVTPRRAFGLRLLLFALLISLSSIALSGAALRSTFLAVALASALLGRFQAYLLLAMKETKFFIAKGDVAIQPKTEEMSPSPTGADAFADWLISFTHGGRYWIAIALGSSVIFIFPSSSTITVIAIVALLWGMRLIYRSIVDPFTPQFFGDPFETWKKEHFTAEPPSKTGTALGESPVAADDS